MWSFELVTALGVMTISRVVESLGLVNSLTMSVVILDSLKRNLPKPTKRFDVTITIYPVPQIKSSNIFSIIFSPLHWIYNFLSELPFEGLNYNDISSYP